MNKLIEAARRALTALNTFHGAVTDTDWKMDFQPEIDALRDALAEPEKGGSLLEAAVLAEREACAKMFDGEVWSYDYREIAARIRARGEAGMNLEEMWKRLAQHQPFADRRGYGPEWATMCAERTEEAAVTAQRAAWVAWAAAARARPAADMVAAWAVAKDADEAVRWIESSEFL